MHTSAQATPTTAPAPRCQIAGHVAQPIELRTLPDGGHVLCITMRTSPGTGGVKAKVPIAPGESALRDAQALAQRINTAVKQGHSNITLSSPLPQAHLHLSGARIDAHPEPARAHKAVPPVSSPPPAPSVSFKSLAANDTPEAAPTLF